MQAALKAVLKYHVVPGARRIPSDFAMGKAVSTLDKSGELTVTTKA
jgi:uncharacterized surface protein with fasciclin (FAS1) repeats